MSATVLLGIDVGTTESKVLATTPTGQELLVRSSRTHWDHHSGGLVDTDGIALADTVIALAAQVVRELGAEHGPVEVAGIGVTGMAEAGVLLRPDGTAAGPTIAWFDPRGDDQLPAVPPQIRERFAAVTGLPLGSQVTAAKLLWLRACGVDLAGLTFLHLPELIVHRLGGRAAAETSLLARTGLLDQGTGQLWPELLDHVGVDATLFPGQVPAGAALGIAGGPTCPEPLRGAALTVAGHDHPVAAVGCGAAGPGEVFDSFGTAQVFLRTLVDPVDEQQRARLVAGGVNAVRHAVPGRWHLLGGTKAGLLMRRTLALLGVVGETERHLLDTAAIAMGDTDIDAMVRVRGAANDDGTLSITAVSDEVGPAALWLAAVRHGIAEGARLLEVMTDEFGEVRSVVVAGGWTRMSSVRREKQRALPPVRFTHRSQAGAFGATAFAAFAHRTAAVTGSTGDHEPLPLSAAPTAHELEDYTRSADRTPEENTA